MSFERHMPPETAIRLIGGLCALLVVLMSAHRPASAQDLRLVALQSASTGGAMEAGQYMLISRVAPAPPSGVTVKGTFRMLSGGLPMLHVPTASEIAFVHDPAVAAELGAALTVAGSLEENVRLDRATLYYRRGGTSDYTSVEMTESDPGVLQAGIPGEYVTREGVAYYFEFEDRAGSISRSPVNSDYGVSVRIDEPGLTLAEPLPGGSDQEAYRMVSVPLLLDEPSVESVYEDDLGPYDPDEWRFFELRFDQSTREHPIAGPIQPGKAYWLISSERQSDVDTGPGVTMSPADTHSIPLHPAWNLVANPFTYPIPRANLRLRSGERIEIRSYEGAWNDPIAERVTSLAPFWGYALYSSSAAVDTLDIHPRPHASAGKQGTPAAVELDWWIRIAARSDRATDRDNVAGVSPEAATDLDPMDFREPPAIGSAVSVLFRRPAPDDRSPAFSTDIRPSSADGHRWDFEVRSGTGKAVSLTFEGLETVPAEYDVLLHDETVDVVKDLRASHSYQLSDAGRSSARRFQLIVGTKKFTSEAGESLDLVPTSVELDPVFPNPIRSSMTVRYGLPEPARVTVRIYDAAGRLLQQIEEGTLDAGRHAFVWESGELGVPLASGVYILEIQAEGIRLARPFTVVR